MASSTRDLPNFNGWRPPVAGIIGVTGYPDSGKTTFALTVPGVKPEEQVFFDNDVKSRALAEQWERDGHPFGRYINLKREFAQCPSKKPIDFYNLVDIHLQELRKEVLKNGPFKTLTFDNFAPQMEEAIRAYALANIDKISDYSQAQARAMSQATYSATDQFYAMWLDSLLEIAPVVFIITHVKDQWVGNSRTGLAEARGRKPLVERCNFRVWTSMNGDPKDKGAPVGLVLKRLPARMAYNLEIQDWEVVEVVPKRIKPLTWRKIIEYQASPIGLRTPSSDELPNETESHLIEGTLTEEAKAAIRSTREAAQAEEDANYLASLPPEKALALDLFKAGTPPMVIKEQIKEKLGMDLQIPDVLKLLQPMQ